MWVVSVLGRRSKSPSVTFAHQGQVGNQSRVPDYSIGARDAESPPLPAAQGRTLLLCH